MGCLQSALRLKPTFTDAYNNMASALVQKGLIPAALQCYNTALACDPNLVSLSAVMPRVTATSGKVEPATTAACTSLHVMAHASMEVHWEEGDRTCLPQPPCCSKKPVDTDVG